MKTKQSARIYAAKIHRDIANHAYDDDFGFASHVTPAAKRDYVARHIKLAEDIESGLSDNNLTVQQRMHYYLTGECVALLS